MTKKVFYYYEVDIPQEVIDAHVPTGGMMVAASILKAKRREYIAKTNSKNAKIIEEFIFACSAFYGFNGTRSAISLEFISERDWQRHRIAVQELRDYFSSEYGIEYVHEVKRELDFEGMQIPEKNADGSFNGDSYWKTKVYFNETLPAARGFDTTCLLAEADGEMTWMEHWQSDLA